VTQVILAMIYSQILHGILKTKSKDDETEED
jgi:hypothetical protein